MLGVKSNLGHSGPKTHVEGREKFSPIGFYPRDDCRRVTQGLQGRGVTEYAPWY